MSLRFRTPDIQKYSLILATCASLALPLDCHAKGSSKGKAVGIGAAFFSGAAESSALIPSLGFLASFSSASPLTKVIHWNNRFEISYATGGQAFGGSLGAYSVIYGAYTPALQFNLGKGNIVPYIEFGPNLGMFIALLSNAGTGTASSQTAFKYGYHIGTGMSWRNGNGGGYGLGVSYFNFLRSPSAFEFPAANLEAKGIRVEFRFLLGK